MMNYSMIVSRWKEKSVVHEYSRVVLKLMRDRMAGVDEKRALVADPDAQKMRSDCMGDYKIAKVKHRPSFVSQIAGELMTSWMEFRVHKERKRFHEQWEMRRVSI